MELKKKRYFSFYFFLSAIMAMIISICTIVFVYTKIENRLVDIKNDSELINKLHVYQILLFHKQSLDLIKIAHDDIDKALAKTDFDFSFKKSIKNDLDLIQKKLKEKGNVDNEVVSAFYVVENKVIQETDRENFESFNFIRFVTYWAVVAVFFFFTTQMYFYRKNQRNFKKIIDLQNENNINLKFKSIGQTTMGISHEINNPLNIIVNANNLMMKKLELNTLDNKNINENLKRIKKASDRIVQIIHGLKALSQNLTPENFEIVSIDELNKITIDYIVDRFDREKISFNLIDDLQQDIECKPIQISQVLIIMLNNSCDAIKDLENRWIKVCFCKNIDPLFFDIQVMDSGPRISDVNIENLGKPFFTTKESKGTGIGLSLVRAIVSEHGGEFIIDKESKTTKFILKLPIKKIIKNDEVLS